MPGEVVLDDFAAGDDYFVAVENLGVAAIESAQKDSSNVKKREDIHVHLVEHHPRRE